MAKYILIQAPNNTDFETENIKKDFGGKIYIVGKFYEKIEVNSLEALEEKLGRLEKTEQAEKD